MVGESKCEYDGVVGEFIFVDKLAAHLGRALFSKEEEEEEAQDDDEGGSQKYQVEVHFYSNIKFWFMFPEL